MATYKTPGVYVEEISTLPPSVAEVATAIPAFIGYTAITGSETNASMVKRITSMLEYKQFFGGPPPVTFTATIKKEDPDVPATPADITLSAPGQKGRFLLYYSLKAFFENGGGPCYVVSIGDYDVEGMQAGDFIGEDGTSQGLRAVALLDEPTLLVFPDATNLGRDQYAQVCDAALAQCQLLGDRFTIMDVRGGAINEPGNGDHGKQHAAVFRDNIRSETEFLKYGAAYTPFLNTLMPFEFTDSNISVKDLTPDNSTGSFSDAYEAKLPSGDSDKYLSVKYTGEVEKPTVNVELGAPLAFSLGEPGKMIIKIPADGTVVTDSSVSDFNTQDVAARGNFSLTLIKPSNNILLTALVNNIPFQQKLIGQLQSATATANHLKVDYAGGGTAPGIIITTAGSSPDGPDVDFSFDEATGQLTIIIKNDPTTEQTFLDAWGGDGHTRFGFTITKVGTGGSVTARTVTLSGVQEFSAKLPPGNNTNFLEVKYDGAAVTPAGIKIQRAADNTSPTAADMSEPVAFGVDDATGELTMTLKDASVLVDDAFFEIWNNTAKTPTQGSFTLTKVLGNMDIALRETESPIALEPQVTTLDALTLNQLNSAKPPGNTALYSLIRQLLGKQRITLPPSPALAGIYARVDRIGGVWKTPANVSVIGLSGPTHIITNREQEDLNVDAVSGKSINAIRSFTGKGTLVWGGRTLAGNDNEWRYVSVRRLFNLIEESVKKSTAFAVFEPNDSTTWLKVKAMIDSYLYGLWQQGALAGSTPEQAYFVNVGLGKTMTPQDILEGRMNVEIGLAAVRPAEFIILKFSHKLQEA